MFAQEGSGFKGLRLALVLLAALAALALAACGGSDEGQTTGADVEDADPAAVEVISGWVRALAAGDTEGAADFFAIPSIAENGSVVVRIVDRGDAVLFNESLPCGAALVSATTENGLTTAVFDLVERPGGDCGSGVGGQAATAFRVENGKIVEWRRVPLPGEGTEPAGGGGERVV